MFDSVEATTRLLAQQEYIADVGLSTSLFLSLKMGKALFLEGEPGVGKTEVAKVLGRLFQTKLIRLQCYEGLDISQAVYEWNYPRQLLEIQSKQSANGYPIEDGAPGLHKNHATEGIFTEQFLLKRPLLQAIDQSHSQAPILLIDELDRADDEFDSFLLELLSDFQITIPEIGTLQAKHAPIVIITSNRTREIHDALKRKEFSQMTPEELEAIKRIMQQMRWQVSLRKTRRYQPDRKGCRIHLHRSMRDAIKHQGIPIRLWWQRQKIKQRPLVLLADISGSMEKYARLLLQFFYTVSHSITAVESFVFGTRLTRITPQLKVKNVDRAVDEAAQTVVDWSGGTRIGESFAIFNRQWSRRFLRRGAIVPVVSDGWERGNSAQLKSEMCYLQHRCHRLIWLNPLSGRANYKPHIEGMAAALPYIDDFLPIHNLQSLSALAEHMAALG